MKEESQHPNDEGAKLSKKFASFIGELGGILALASVKAPKAEKRLFGDAFIRTLNQATALWEKAYREAPPKEKKQIEKKADSVIKTLHELVALRQFCCVGGEGETAEECRGSGGVWACLVPPEEGKP